MATPKKIGRPTLYTKELGEYICEIIGTHPSGLNKLIAQYPKFPQKSTIFAWRLKYPEFSNSYKEAKKSQAELLAEECIDIADEDAEDLIYNDKGALVANTAKIQRAILRINTRKWHAAKLLPTVYGEAILGNDGDHVNQELLKETRQLREELTKKHKKEY